MRAVISGLRYDTEKAELVGSFASGHDTRSFRYYEEELYRTARGAWFLAGRGNDGLTERGRLRLRAADVRIRLPRLKASVERHSCATEAVRERLVLAVRGKADARKGAAREYALTLSRCMTSALRAQRQRFEVLLTRLTLAEPDAVVARGFVIARSGAGEPVTSAWEARDLEVLELQFADGTVCVHIGAITTQGGEA